VISDPAVSKMVKLRPDELEAAYVEAWDEWQSSGEADVWDVTTGDGLGGITATDFSPPRRNMEDGGAPSPPSPISRG
jgi:hypothetical protein